MSLILDALRKSEAERRRGQAPGLHVELAPAPSQTPVRRPRRMRREGGALLVAGVAAVLLLAWWIGEPSPEADQPASAATTAPATSAPAPAKLEPATASAPPAKFPATATMPEPATRPPPVEPAPPPAIAEAPAPVQAPAPPKPAGDAQDPATTPAVPSSEPASTELVPTTGQPATAEPTPLADLSAGERRQLPPLKISMHFWAPAQTRRFAIIDGARVGEGDRIGNAVVEAITRDAVVIAWNGQRVRLPIR